MIKAVIFDFDGLILDTESIWFQAYRDVLEEYGIALSLEGYGQVIGTNDGRLYKYIKSLSDVALNQDVVEKAAHDRYITLMSIPVTREGVVNYLQSAKDAGLKIGLASSSQLEWVEGYLKQLGIHHFFEVIKTKDHVKKTKPDPEVYIQTIDALGIQPEEAFAFEDSLNGLTAARAAGLRCVIIPNKVTSHSPFRDFTHRLSSMADMSFQEVIKIVESK